MDFGLYCLQVGHGLCLVLVFPGRIAWMFDCGGDRRIIEDFLEYVDTIEHVFLTHTHSDHVGNLWWICRRKHIDTLWLPAVTPSIPKECAKWLLRAKEEKTVAKIRTAILDNGVDQTRPLATSVETSENSAVLAELLYPTALESLLGQSNQGSLVGLAKGSNVFSCVYRIVYRGKRVLVPGDVDMSALHRLAMSSADTLKCDLLIAPHHGKPENVEGSPFSFDYLADRFGCDVAFVSNSSAPNRENWPPDSNFIGAMAASGTKVVCTELTFACRCGGAVKGPLRRGSHIMGLSDGGRDRRACFGTLRVVFKGGEFEYVDLQQHSAAVGRNTDLARIAPCLPSQQ